MTILVGFFLVFVGWYNLRRHQKHRKTGIYLDDHKTECRRDERPASYKFNQKLLWLGSWAMIVGGAILVMLRLFGLEIIDGDL